NDGCGSAAALAGRSRVDMGLSIEPCPQLGAETIDRPLGGDALPCGQECRGGVDSRHPTMGGYGRSAQRAAIRRRRGRGLKSIRSGPPVCFQRRSNALMSTWGMAVVRDFRTAARAARLAADERPVAVV